jgi:hypothetical protein
MATKKSGSLFEKAKKSAPTTKQKDEKVQISIKDVDFFNKIEALELLQENLKRDKAKADMLSDEIKDTAREEWIKLYEKQGKNPGSVCIVSDKEDDKASVLFVPSDKYISINAERAESLIEKYGEDIVEEKTTFSFDNDMIEKYGEIISILIEESNEIDESDKGKIIKAVSAFSITKGTIDKMKSYGEVSELMEEIKPVISLKNVEIIKG